jgi:hypothetical protein
LGAGQHGCVVGGAGDEERSRFAVFLIERDRERDRGGRGLDTESNQTVIIKPAKAERGEERRGWGLTD